MLEEKRKGTYIYGFESDCCCGNDESGSSGSGKSNGETLGYGKGTRVSGRGGSNESNSLTEGCIKNEGIGGGKIRM